MERRDYVGRAAFHRQVVERLLKRRSVSVDDVVPETGGSREGARRILARLTVRSLARIVAPGRWTATAAWSVSQSVTDVMDYSEREP